MITERSAAPSAATWLLAVLAVLLTTPCLAVPLVIDRFDTNHSTLAFTVPILNGLSEVEGKVTDFKVVIHYDAADLARSTVEATAVVASLDTGIPERDQDLRGAGFFNAAAFPEIRFVSTSIDKTAAGAYLVHGDLTLHGVTRSLAVPFTLRTKEENGKLLLSVRGDLTLNRDDFGMTWRHPVKDFVSNQVTVRIRLLSKLVPLPDTVPPKPQ